MCKTHTVPLAVAAHAPYICFHTLLRACDTNNAWWPLGHNGGSDVRTGTAAYLLPLLADSDLVLLSQAYFQVCTMLLQDSHPPRCSLL